LSHADDNNADLVKDWQADADAAQRCPSTSVEVAQTSMDDLNARARKLGGSAVAAPVETPAPVAAKAQPGMAAADTVAQRLKDWAAAWMSKDADRYLGFYAKDFAPGRSTSAKWITERRRLVTKPGVIDLKLDQIKATPQGDAVVTTFVQNYTSANFKDSVSKVLTWKQIAGEWMIIKESNR
jgi:adhesin transport system outer membrane protein